MKTFVGLVLGLLSLGPWWFARGATEETITLDIAFDCRTFSYNRGVPLEQIVPGDGYILSAKVFPAGTLPPGSQMNDPNGTGSLGSFVTRGTTNATLADHIANPNVPGVFETGYLLFKDGGLVSNGWFAPGGNNKAAITGGWGTFRGASGELSFTDLGTNKTGCPNSRATIILVKQAPR